MRELLNIISPLALSRLVMGLLFGTLLLFAVLSRHRPQNEYERYLGRSALPVDFLLFATTGGVMVYGFAGFAAEWFFGLTSDAAGTIGLTAMGVSLGAFAAFGGLRWCARAPQRRALYRQMLGLDREQCERRGVVLTSLSAERTGTVRLEPLDGDGKPEDVPARAAQDVYARCETLLPGTEVCVVSLKDDLLIVKPRG